MFLETRCPEYREFIKRGSTVYLSQYLEEPSLEETSIYMYAMFGHPSQQLLAIYGASSCCTLWK